MANTVFVPVSLSSSPKRSFLSEMFLQQQQQHTHLIAPKPRSFYSCRAEPEKAFMEPMFGEASEELNSILLHVTTTTKGPSSFSPRQERNTTNTSTTSSTDKRRHSQQLQQNGTTSNNIIIINPNTAIASSSSSSSSSSASISGTSPQCLGFLYTDRDNLMSPPLRSHNPIPRNSAFFVQ